MADPVDDHVSRVAQTSDEPLRFQPQVQPPIARLRPVFVIAFVATAAFALGVIAWDMWIHPREVTAAEPAAVLRGCTSLEVEQTVRAAAMSDIERAMCLAVAGKIDRARELLHTMTDPMRAQAISEVFNVAHPIADRGDDESAGPIMALVVEFWPDNYMAVFHAGMAEFALGHDAAARLQLERFLAMYQLHDVWRARADRSLAAMATHTELSKREAHFPE
ncbi:MAG: hypothetical protein E6J90_10990 [Deltaproteobacteria bacterium]|nr:MAG: hypothetical protein E6J91_27950 [Deltaproteobacteria bacterium]TMQ23184.1 MAG: hypothetical protein E6J90_10990 [Deltaproteobacteria bacterium]